MLGHSQAHTEFVFTDVDSVSLFKCLLSGDLVTSGIKFICTVAL